MIRETELTRQLGIRHPILLATMDIVSGSLTAAVSWAGGFEILGAATAIGVRELAVLKDLLAPRPPPFGIGFIT